MLIRVLGPVDVVDHKGNNVALRGLVPTRLLALLIAGQPGDIPIDDLALQIWSHTDQPADPVGSLRTVVTRVRGVLGPESIVTGTGSYRLGDIETDVGRFEELVERARRSSGSPTVADLWRQALGLWRGPAFGDHSDAESIQAEANRLEELRAEATEAWFDARLAAGEGRELVSDVEAAATEFPLREGFRAQQMTVLARAGRQAEALRAYQEFRGDMTEIGLEPSARLAELESQIAAGDVPRSGARRTLRGYELGDRLGEGAFAIVHSARQASVDRQVAIKQIRADLADQPDFIRQFEAEAHLVARLEHPHIVPLYDYWREPGSAYLVMRHLEGGSMQRRIINEPFDVDELAPMVSQVAAGLDEAHRSGVIHRDVKPANILLDNSGNAYLSDFGIAVEEQERLDPEAWLSNGSPVYAPPEQLRREAVGPAADVHALGVSVFEALTGRLPFPTETTLAGLLERQLNDPIPLVRSSHPDTPAAVDTVLQKATAKDPAERHQTAGEFANDLAVAAGLEGDTELITPEDRNPYKGLRAFDEADATDFAGRDRLITQLVSAVATERAVLVVGPSGSGKSSVVKAGLLPALRNGATAGSDRWFVTTMIPDTSPFADLAEALLRVAIDPPPDLASELRGDVNGITRMIRRVIPDGRELVLVIDQFEELFTLTDEKERERFLEGLVAANNDTDTPLRLVLTLRADFYDQPLRHPEFAKLIHNATIPVHPLAADELERAITEPARAVGAGFEPSLVAQITADIADQPGALPLLQYALTELYDRRDGQTMTRQAYTELGGVSGALARRAEQVYDTSSSAQQAATRRLFGRLVNLGDGTEDTRRRILRKEVSADSATETAVDAYGLARLLSFDRDSATREPTVEVAHEALIREWPRLRGWLDDDRAGLRILRHLTETSTNWERNGRETSELYRGGRLEAVAEWATDHSSDLNPTEAAFLSASVEQRESEAEAERRTNRRLRRLLAGVGIVAVVALLAGLLAFQQRGQATDNAATAETERIAAEAASRVDDNPQLALLLAAEAHNRDPGPTGLGALQQTLTQTDNFLGVIGADRSYTYLHWLDEHRFVAAGESGIDVYSYPEGELLLEVNQPVKVKWFSPTGDGTVRPEDIADFNRSHGAFFPADEDCCLSFVDLQTGSVTTSSVEIERLPEARYNSMAMDVHPTRPLAAILDGFGTLRLFDMTNGQMLWEVAAYPEKAWTDFDLPEEYDGTLLLPGSIFHVSLLPALDTFPRTVTFTSGGNEIATSGIAWRFWRTEDGTSAAPERIRNCWGAGDPIIVAECSFDDRSGVPVLPLTPVKVGLHPDGRIVEAYNQSLILGDDATELRLATTGQWFGLPHVQSFEFIDGERVAVQLTDRRVILLDTTSPDRNQQFATALNEPGHAGLSPGGTVLAVPARNGIGLWSLDGKRLLATGLPRRGALTASVDSGGQFVTGADADWYFSLGYEASPFRTNVSTGETTEIGLDDVGNPIEYLVEYPPGGDLLVAFGLDGGARAYDPVSLEVVGDYQQLGFSGAAPSPNGTFHAFGTQRGGQGAALQLYGIDGEHVETFEIPVPPSTISFSHDDSLLAAASPDDGGFFSVWDTETLEVVHDGTAIADSVQALRYSPDGRYLATIEFQGDLVLRDPHSNREISRIPGAREKTFLNTVIAFSADSRYLVTGGGQTLRIFDLELGVQIGDTFPNDPDFRFGVNDGPQLVTAVGDHMLLWNLSLDEWYDIACQAAGRNMTKEEWEQFGPNDEEYRATCPQWPIET